MYLENIKITHESFLLINFFINDKTKENVKIVDTKLFKKTYPFICDKCGEFAHTDQEYCDKCGASNSLRKAEKADYKKANK